VRSEGLPLRLGVRDGHTSDSPETPVAIAACVALGLDGVRGLVADRQAYCQRTLGGVWHRAWEWSRSSHAPVRGARTWRRGASSRGRCPYGWKNRDAPARSRRDVGRGTVASAVCPWRTRTGASTWPRDFSRGPLEPVGPPDGRSVCCCPSEGSRADRRACPAGGGAVVGLCRRGGGGHRHLGRPWAGPAGPLGPPLALSYAPLSGRSWECPQETDTARPAAAGREAPGRGPLSPCSAP